MRRFFIAITVLSVLAVACTPEETIFSTEVNHSGTKPGEGDDNPGDDNPGDDNPVDYQGVDPRFFSLIDLSLPGLEAAKVQLEQKDVVGSVEAVMEYIRTRTVVNPGIDLTDKYITDGQKSIADQAKEGRFYTMSYYEGVVNGQTQYWLLKGSDGKISWDTAPSGVADPGEYIKQIHRLMWMPYQAKAYNATGDESYVQSIMEVYDDYLASHPVPSGKGSGTAWTGLQGSQRLLGWIDILPYIISSPSLTPQWFAKMMVLTYDSIECLRQTWYLPATSNIYFTQVQALLEDAIFFPEFVKAGEWFNEGVSLVTSQLVDQFNEDGVQNELDPSYHMGIVEDFRSIHAFAQANDRLASFPSDYIQRLHNSCRFVMDIMYPNYGFENFNDTRSARQSKSVLLRNLQNYHTMFPDDGDIEYMASDRSEGKAPTALVRQYATSGYYMMRSSWEQDGMMLIHKNNYNVNNAWHCQPDNGTVALYNKGRRFLPDAGVFTYTSGSVRNAYASTSWHNTMTMVGKTIANGHMLGRLLSSKSTADYELIVTENPSYDGLTHRRAIFMVNREFFVIVDEGYGSASSTVNIHWHLCSDTSSGGLGKDVVVMDDKSAEHVYGAHTVFTDNNNLLLRTFVDTTDGFAAGEGTSSCSNEIDNSYERKHYVVSLTKAADKATRFITVLYPFGAPADADGINIQASFEGESGVFNAAGATVNVTVNGQNYTLAYTI